MAVTLRISIGSAHLSSGLVVRDLPSPVLVRACPSQFGLWFCVGLVRAMVQVRLDDPCLDRVLAEAEYRPDRSSVMLIPDPVPFLFLSIRRDLLFSLSACRFPSFFAGVVPGLLVVVFHIIGLTWAHGPDCRFLRNRFKGLLSAPDFVWAL